MNTLFFNTKTDQPDQQTMQVPAVAIYNKLLRIGSYLIICLIGLISPGQLYSQALSESDISTADTVIFDFVDGTLTVKADSMMINMGPCTFPLSLPYNGGGSCEFDNDMNDTMIFKLKLDIDTNSLVDIFLSPAASGSTVTEFTDTIRELGDPQDNDFTFQTSPNGDSCILFLATKASGTFVILLDSIKVCDLPTAIDTSVTICSGDSLNFDFDSLVTSMGAVNFAWGSVDSASITGDEVTLTPLYSRSDRSIDTILYNTGTNDITTEYKVAVYSVGNTSCADTVSLFVTVHPPLMAPVIYPNDSIEVCQGENPVVISGPDGGSSEYSFQWSCVSYPVPIGTILSNDTIYNPSFLGSAAVAGNYSIELSVSDQMCMDTLSDTLHVTVHEAPVANAGLSDYGICLGSSVQLGGSPTATGGSGSYTYLWTPSEGLSNDTISNPDASPEVSTMYRVVVTDAEGCTSIDSTMVTVVAPPIDVEAEAICDPTDNMTYHLSVVVNGGTGGPYVVTINGGTPQLISSGDPASIFGPFTHSDTSDLITGVDTVVVTNSGGGVSCSTTIEVAETFCGFGNDTTGCESICPIQEKGFIMAQSEPGTFVSGGASGRRQSYLLVDTLTDEIIRINETGYFNQLFNGGYDVYAINYSDTSTNSIFTLPSSINDTTSFDPYCVDICRSSYSVLCPSCETLTLTKSVDTVVTAASGIQGNYDISYIYILENIGNLDLENIGLEDDLSSQFGGGFVGISAGPFPSRGGVNGTYDGTAANPEMLNMTAVLDTMSPMDTMSVRLTVEIDPDNPTAIYDASGAFANSAIASGFIGGALMMTVRDTSDDNSDLDNNLSPDNETGGDGDTTLIFLPDISVTKAVTQIDIQSDGDARVTFELEVQNTGNTVLDSIIVTDSLTFLPGATPTTQQSPISVVLTNIDAETLPNSNQGNYDGVTNVGLLDSVSGKMNPGERFLITVLVDLDPQSFSLLSADLKDNQAEASGQPKDNSDNTLTDPATSLNYTVGAISDLSDDGTDLSNNGNPTDDNTGSAGDGSGMNLFDDPTPINLPAILRVTKSLDNVLIDNNIDGNALAQFRFRVYNIGGASALNVTLEDNFFSEFGSGFVEVDSIPVVSVDVDPLRSGSSTLNPTFTGFSPNIDIVSIDTLGSGDSLEVSLWVELDLDLLPNPAENQATVNGEDINTGEMLMDESDNVTPGDPDEGTTNDPTPFPIVPSVAIAKNVKNIQPTAVTDVHEVTFQLVVENTGNDSLHDLQVFDTLSLASRTLSCAFDSIVSGSLQVLPGTPNASVIPTANTAFESNDSLSLISLADSSLLLPGEQFIVEFTIVMDPTGCPQAFENQAFAVGTGTQGTMTQDASDSGTNPATSNSGNPGDTGGTDDPTPFNLPGQIRVAKTVSNIAPDTDDDGLYEVTYQFEICNVGGTDLMNINLYDDFQDQFGLAFDSVVLAPGVTNLADSTRLSDPTGNSNFDGLSLGDFNLLNGDGGLAPGECIIDTVIIRVDVSAAPALGLLNQARATGLDPDGILVEDASDNGVDATTDNGDGGTNDPTPLYIPEIGLSKTVDMVQPAASGTQGNFDVTYRLTIENVGTTILDSIVLTDAVSDSLSPGFVGFVSLPAVSSSSATTDPTINSLTFNGTSGMDSIYTGIDGRLRPGENITIIYTVELDASTLPAMPDNQGFVFGDPVDMTGNSIGNTVSDASDSGTDPDGNNPDEDGDTGGSDDPTPVFISSIGLAKSADIPVPVSGMPGLFDVPLTFVIENTGIVTLDNISLLDDLNLQYGASFVQVVGTPILTDLTTASTGGGVVLTPKNPTSDLVEFLLNLN